MSDAITATPPPPPVVPPERKRGVAWLAWLVILAVVGFEVLWPRLRPSRAKAEGDAAAQRVLANMQIRQLVGWAEIFGQRQAIYEQAKKSLDTGPVADRLRFVVLAGDLAGPQEALEQIDNLQKGLADQDLTPEPEQREVLDALTRLYKDRRDGTATLTDADRDLLPRQLGWTGELALTPPDAAEPAREAVVRPAKRFFATLMVVAGGVITLGLFGLVGLVVWAVLFVLGQTRRGLPRPTAHGGVYAEAFAVYMVVFLGLAFAHRLLRVPGPELLLQVAGMLISLAAGLAWPVLRGVPWREVRRELGLTLGPRPWLEPLIGLCGYALVVPLFGVGVIITAVLAQVERRAQVGDRPERHFSPIEQPSHPIVEWLQHPDWSLLAQVALVACVMAPLVEETMFRGALYRHLRNATERRLGRVGSFLVSAVLVSFLFAVIHPQGLVAVPALMGLALGLTVLREWRGSLLPSMMVHGIHNGLTTFVLVQALRD
jgi:membrane protease YdiL (CAAX protease family)